MNFNEKLRQGFVLLDGAMGTMLQQKGMAAGTCPDILNIEKPEWIRDIHRQYCESGALVLYTNTFGANRYKLKNSTYSVEEVIRAGIQNAREACRGRDILVALDLGPTGKMPEPAGDLSFQDAYDCFRECAAAGKDADLIVLETMADLYEMKAALLAVKENTDLPVLCTMTFESTGRTFLGCSISAMALTLESLGADAIGINCSLGPSEMEPLIRELAKWTSLPLILKPNAGLPDPVTNQYLISPEQFAKQAADLCGYGVRLFGGCCGTTPDFIRALRGELSCRQPEFVQKEGRGGGCSAYATTENIPAPASIPVLSGNDPEELTDEALDLVDGGAEVLCLSGFTDPEKIRQAVRILQSAVRVPLQFDSGDPEILESALRVYNGRPIVLWREGRECIYPVARKYGAVLNGDGVS